MTLFVNARVIPSARIGEARGDAVLVRGERVAAVGQATRLHPDLAAGEEVIDLQGAVVLPGFVDAHVHTGLYARGLFSADLRDYTSLEAALQRVAAHLRDRVEAAKAEGTWPQQPQWIFGQAWDHNVWDVPQVPDRRALDAVTGSFPTALHSTDAHTWWVNSAALEALGLDASTPDPVGGSFDRDTDGQLTGILRESAGRAVDQILASGAAGDLTAQLEHAQRQLWAQGLVGVHDFDGEDVRAGFSALHETGRLRMRVTKAVLAPNLDLALAEGRYTGSGDAWLRTGPVKIFSDGALGSHTCLMHEPLAGSTHGHGVAVTEEAELRDLLARSASAGLAVATHAIGDRANELVLDAYQWLAEQVSSGVLPASPLVHRTEHAQHLAVEDVRRFAALGVVPSMQPLHATADFELAERLMGDRPMASYAWRSLIDAGATLAFGSDAPVEPPSPLGGIHAAVTRQRPDGRPDGGWQPQEHLSVGEAITGFTTGAAHAAGMGHLTGEIRPGMFADFTVLREDPFAVAPSDLPHIPVAGVITGGRVRHWV
ncbi:amidohydrolase [Nesterenkonia sp. K-15-9-6]|uniref:amidohydrolase n=1 Tax=Nesterenkonia sp. K-15-9-6 TaxID=3093918 RepID=UPI004044BA9C